MQIDKLQCGHLSHQPLCSHHQDDWRYHAPLVPPDRNGVQYRACRPLRHQCIRPGRSGLRGPYEAQRRRLVYRKALQRRREPEHPEIVHHSQGHLCRHHHHAVSFFFRSSIRADS